MIKSLIRAKPNSIIYLSSAFIIPSRIKFSISFIYLHLKLTHLFYTFRDIVLISPQWTNCICFRNSHFLPDKLYPFYFYRYALFLHFMYLFAFLIISHFYPVFTAMSKIDHIIVKNRYTQKKLRALTLLPQLCYPVYSAYIIIFTRNIFSS